MQVSENFTLAEATVSSTAKELGMSNIPDPIQWDNIRFTARQMELVRLVLEDKPIRINSWFRSKALNSLIGGVHSSQHLTGEAVDFVCPKFGTPLEICKRIVEAGIEFDQLIQEGTWVHISFKKSGNRGSVLTLVGSGRYRRGLG